MKQTRSLFEFTRCVKKKATLSFVQFGNVMVRLFCIVVRSSHTNQRYVDKTFTHMPCQSIRLLEKKISSSKTMPRTCNMARNCIPPWLTFCISIHFQSTSPLIFETGGYMTCIPSKQPHYPNGNTSWLNNGSVIHKKGVQMYTLASSKHTQKAHRMN